MLCLWLVSRPQHGLSLILLHLVIRLLHEWIRRRWQHSCFTKHTTEWLEIWGKSSMANLLGGDVGSCFFYCTVLVCSPSETTSLAFICSLVMMVRTFTRMMLTVMVMMRIVREKCACSWIRECAGNHLCVRDCEDEWTTEAVRNWTFISA